MAQCISPFYKKDTGLSFPCGKCYPCKARRVSGWSFRLQKEAERSDRALFVTLTYSTETVPITARGYMTLRKKDIQDFMKRLRINTFRNTGKKPKIKYYCAGEYGGKTQRPHYHLLMFNADYKEIEESWKLGSIHYGTLTPASSAYTLKYISKTGMTHHANDDRVVEFSLMSKRLGDNYLSDRMVKWHRERGKSGELANHFYLQHYDYKIAIPRYYKQKIWSKMELQLIGAEFQRTSDLENNKKNIPELLADSEKNDNLRSYFSSKNGESRQTHL